MFLVVGLGNPGREYAANRHNIGFMAADALVRRYSFGPWRSRFQGETSEGTVAGHKILLLKPTTFMNLSGQSAAAAARFFKIAPEQVIVLHDDMDLAEAKVRVKRGGGSGGHNGLKSLDQHVGNATLRVRLGIGHPGDRDQVVHHVLSNFAKGDQAWLDPLLEGVADEFPLLLDGKDSLFMSRLAQHVSAHIGKKESPHGV